MYVPESQIRYYFVVNERYIFVFAALVAELGASVAFYLISPNNPLCANVAGLPNYLDRHAAFDILFWIPALGGIWILNGPQLLRLRQKFSTKLFFLANLALVGVMLDNLVSLYVFETFPAGPVGIVSTSGLIAALAERTVLYLLFFSGAVLVGFLVTHKRRSVVTPPPRFGRH